nr:MAG TPA: hypothetical protein [Bacteriophage sp.]
MYSDNYPSLAMYNLFSPTMNISPAFTPAS